MCSNGKLSLFQLFVMLRKLFLFVLLAPFVLSCEVVVWRMTQIHCCPNGTYVVVGTERIWSKSVPLACGVGAEGQLSVAPFVWTLTILFCIYQTVQSVLACVFARMYRYY